MEESSCEYNNIDAEMSASRYLPEGVSESIENGQSEIDLEENMVTIEKVKFSEQVMLGPNSVNISEDYDVIGEAKNRASLVQRKTKHYKDYDEVSLKTHRGVKPHQCEECKNKFGQKSHLIRHMALVHRGEKAHKCKECEQKFGQESHMKRHMSNVHQGLKSYQCEQCEQSFGREYHMQRHMARVHKGVKAHKCQECEMKFGSKYHLKRHLDLTHLGVKPYQCKECEKTFGRKSHLMRHFAAAHIVVKTYQCELCEKQFSLKIYYKRHISNAHKKKMDNTSQENIRVLNSKNVNLKVKRASTYINKENKNREIIEKQTEAVIDNQYLSVCNICQAILLSQEGFKIHLMEHEEKFVKCPSTTKHRSCMSNENAILKETKALISIGVKCSFCLTVFENNLQLERHWFQRRYCCLKYNAVSEPVTGFTD